ncbi:transglycosylase domain-containing protein [Naumannella cuiyingiana]|uniref:Membrane peptidoglycan carboxypeptidase n=1 Tax=Naumannella cuiyingiana TaxID=1347891 RepID=A0A7Z0ILA3_9ACTN|nr:transglycosylase domain-containing protein [Naumannella cuiyingiana]NYI71346.1 membrane peptidoglycan carboxypeptidase [Naumannella cuiyingiana]
MPNSSERGATLLYSLAMFGVVSVICGILVAGLMVPYAALATAGAKAGASTVEDLPEDLVIPPQSQRTSVYMADGKLLTNFYEDYRIYKPLDDISPTMVSAQLAIEDHRFYEHGPLDLTGTLRALVTNVGGGDTQGGSSITQQYVKMAQIDIAKRNNDQAGIARAQESTIQRKIQELRYAIALEKQLSKDDIIERYLNIAMYGPSVYGVEAAAQVYFDKSAKDLDLAESAFLAGLVQNPTRTDPADNPDAALERRNVVLNRMAELQLVTRDEAAKAKEEKFDPKKIERPTNNCANSRYPFLCDYVKKTITTNPMYGETPEDRENLLLRGGLEIQTEIDPKAQDAAEKAVADMISPKDPALGVMSQIQPGTGLIIAMAQSRPEMGNKPGQTFYNYAVSREMGGAEGYQMGSTFKAFTAAAAIEKGIPLSQTYASPSGMEFKGRTMQTCNGPVKSNQYDPKNSTRSGTFNMRQATAYSVNTYFVQLQLAAGNCRVAQMADKAGLQLSQGGTLVDPGPTANEKDPMGYDNYTSLTLGIADVTPLSVAEAYATFAARGKHCKPIIIKAMKDSNGKDVKVPSADCKQVMDQGVADATTELLRGVMNGTGAPARIPGGYPQAGKTGTIDSNSAVWFAGYTPEVAGAAMIAVDKTNDYWDNRRKSLKGMRLPESGTYLAGSGGGDAGRGIYAPAMEKALEGKPRTGFKQASSKFTQGKNVDVPSTSGMSASQARETLEGAGFNVARQSVYSSQPSGSYLGTSANGSAKAGQTIYLMYSKGPRPKPAPAPAPKKEPEKKDDKKPEKKDEKPADKPQTPSDSGGG